MAKMASLAIGAIIVIPKGQVMTRLAKLWFRLSRKQAGISFIETLVGLSILATIGVIFMTSLGTAYKSAGMLDEKLQAEVLARSQLEKIKEAPYQESEGSGWYQDELIVDLPPQYSIIISVTPPTCVGTAEDCTPLEELIGEPITTIQEITVSIYHGGKSVLSVACYKVKT